MIQKINYGEFEFGENHYGAGSGSGRGPGGWNGGIRDVGPNWRHKKLDLLVFDGTNPDGWILRAERYFKFLQLNEAHQVEVAVVALEGDSLLWFQWENRRHPIVS